MRTNELTQDCIEALRVRRPEIAIEVTRELDQYFTWDGDGEDPANQGYLPYNVLVIARTIVKGTMYEGMSCLGGSYYLPSEPCGDIHGYLPQMLSEAVADLYNAIA